MKVLIYSVMSFFILSSLTKEDNGPHLLYSGKFISATAEKVLYKNEKTKQFLIKFIIKNTSEKTVGVYLDYEFDAFYPHHYGVHDTSFHDHAKEIRMQCEYKLHKDSINKMIIGKFSEKKLMIINPKQSIEYFVPMEIHVDDHQLEKEEYLIISCDGHLFSTDGNSVMHDCLFKKNITAKQRDVVFGHPIKFAPLPANADIIESH